MIDAFPQKLAIIFCIIAYSVYPTDIPIVKAELIIIAHGM